MANLGREDQIDLAALRRLVASIGRYLDRVEPDAAGESPAASGRHGGRRPAAADPSGWAGPPPAADRLVGRDGALADLPALLSRYPLVTITGPAGVGKTRLAAEFAHRAHRR